MFLCGYIFNGSLEKSIYLILKDSELRGGLIISHSKEVACYECHVKPYTSESRNLTSLSERAKPQGS